MSEVEPAEVEPEFDCFEELEPDEDDPEEDDPDDVEPEDVEPDGVVVS